MWIPDFSLHQKCGIWVLSQKIPTPQFAILEKKKMLKVIWLYDFIHATMARFEICGGVDMMDCLFDILHIYTWIFIDVGVQSVSQSGDLN